MELVLAGVLSTANARIWRRWRDRGGRAALWLAELGGVRRRRAPRRRVGLSGAGHRFGRTRVRRRRRARQPAGPDAAHRARARQRRGRARAACCASSPTPPPAPAGCAGSPRSDGRRSCGRSPAAAAAGAAASAPRRRAAAHRRRRRSCRRAMSAAGCCPRATAPARACGCSPRRPRRRFAASGARSLAWLLGVGRLRFHPRRRSPRASPRPASPAACSAKSPKVGGGSITTPTGYVGLLFLFFVLAVSLFACSQIAAARREEADERLETLLALPSSRRRWLAGRLALAAVGRSRCRSPPASSAWVGGAIAGRRHLAREHA